MLLIFVSFYLSVGGEGVKDNWQIIDAANPKRQTLLKPNTILLAELRGETQNNYEDKTIPANGGLLEQLYVCLRFRDITPNNGEPHGKEHGQ